MQISDDIRDEILNRDTTNNQNKYNRKIEYLRTWLKYVKFVKASTCVYQFKSPKTDKKYLFIHYFIILGLGSCVRMGSHVSHMFYAGKFDCCTAITILILDDIIYFSTKEDFNVFEWGNR